MILRPYDQQREPMQWSILKPFQRAVNFHLLVQGRGSVWGQRGWGKRGKPFCFDIWVEMRSFRMSWSEHTVAPVFPWQVSRAEN